MGIFVFILCILFVCDDDNGAEWLNARRLDKSTAPHGPILNWALVLIIQLESIAMSHINQNHYLYVETFFLSRTIRTERSPAITISIRSLADPYFLPLLLFRCYLLKVNGDINKQTSNCWKCKQSINEDKSIWHTLLTNPFTDKTLFQTFDLWLMNETREAKRLKKINLLMPEPTTPIYHFIQSPCMRMNETEKNGHKWTSLPRVQWLISIVYLFLARHLISNPHLKSTS